MYHVPRYPLIRGVESTYIADFDLDGLSASLVEIKHKGMDLNDFNRSIREALTEYVEGRVSFEDVKTFAERVLKGQAVKVREQDLDDGASIDFKFLRKVYKRNQWLIALGLDEEDFKELEKWGCWDNGEAFQTILESVTGMTTISDHLHLRWALKEIGSDFNLRFDLPEDAPEDWLARIQNAPVPPVIQKVLKGLDWVRIGSRVSAHINYKRKM